MRAAPGYTIDRKIATGGMAEVWLAHPVGEPHVNVALKRILPQLAGDPDFVTMFLDEARIAATLEHPNVVRMREVGSDGTSWFIVMEFLDGDNVRALLRQLGSLGRPMGLAQALAIVVGAAAGLHYAHERLGTDGRPLRIVHRDVSPQNLFVTRDGAVKLVDFGIAKAASRSTETQAGTMKGKIPYMSPEQCGGEALDRRSDVWSLGVVMYELTVGRRFVRRAPDYLMMKQITEEPVLAPSQVRPMYPPELERIVLKALAPRRGQRYQTMEDLRADLVAFAAREGFDLGAAPLAMLVREALGGERVSPVEDDDRPPPTDEQPLGLPELKARSVAVVWTPGPEQLVRRPGAQAPAVSRRRVGAVEVVSLQGRLTESFGGAALGATLAGDVVLDLGGVERVTSFGVREWLALHQAAGQATTLYLANCTEPVVNQLTMIRGFARPRSVLSFRAPYVCVAGRHAFQRLIDAEADAAAVHAKQPPAATCPTCGAEGTFDDDPHSYFAIASLLATDVPAAIRAATGPVDTVGRPSLEKVVDAEGPRLLVRGTLTAELRWRAALEGADGALRVDLQGVTSVAPDAGRALVGALRGIRRDVSLVAIDGCPAALAADLSGEAWITVRSWQGGVPAGMPTAVPPSPAPRPASLPPLEPSRGVWAFAGAGLALSAMLLVAGLGVGALAVWWSPPPPTPLAPPVVVGPSAPDWALDAAGLTLAAEGEGPTLEAAVTSARRAAIGRLVVALAEHAGRPTPSVESQAVQRYEAAFGAFANPARGAVERSVRGGAVQVRVVYTLPRAAWDEALARVSPVSGGGVTVLPALPSDPDEAWTVTASTDPDVPVGAKVTALDGVALTLGARIDALSGRVLSIATPGGTRSVRLR